MLTNFIKAGIKGMFRANPRQKKQIKNRRVQNDFFAIQDFMAQLNLIHIKRP